MSTRNKNVPAPAATGSEDINESAKNSTTTAYLSRWGSNTRETFGTWSGADLRMKDHIAIIVPFEVVQAMYAYGPQSITINGACARAHSDAARAQRETRRLNDIAVARKCAEADILFAVELLDALGTDEWTPLLATDARDFIESLLDRDVDQVTAELLEECRHECRARLAARLAELGADQ